MILSQVALCLSVSASSGGNTVSMQKVCRISSPSRGNKVPPNRTTIPARSALHYPGEAGPTQDEVLEEEERVIASMALYIASAP